MGEIKLAGTSFYQDAIAELCKKHPHYLPGINLVRDPKNKYDKNAIKVMFEDILIGWIPKQYAVKYAAIMDSERKLTAKFVSWNTTTRGKSYIGATINLKEE